MEIESVQAALPQRVCEQARLSRDPRFDGLFFTAVTSTHIYCRPVCPVPTVDSANVRYYPSAAAAEAAGFRPCLRCRPELAPGAWPRGDAVLERALKLIDEGLLADQPLAALAERVNVGERQLRRLFLERLGASPKSVHGTRRLLFAKQLLTETNLSMTDVAMHAGFGSLRRFNSAFRKSYRMAPSKLRRTPQAANGDDGLVLRLGFRPPFDYSFALDYLRPRVVDGVESVDDHAYARVFGPPDAPGWLRLERSDDEQTLRLHLHCPQTVRILDVVSRLRRMFDLDADPESISRALSIDDALRPLIERDPGLRLVGGWSCFEVAVRQILESRHGVAQGGRLASSLALHYGTVLEAPFSHGLERLFPAPEGLADVDAFAAGLPADSAMAVRALARALLEGRVDFRSERTLEEFVSRCTALPGIEEVDAHNIAMRALTHPDAFPVDGDLLDRLDGAHDAAHHGLEAFRQRAEQWRPWRAYALAFLLRVSESPRRSGDRQSRQPGANSTKPRSIER